MLIRLKLRGSGTEDDPYSVDLPTYRLIEHDTKKMTAIIEIPDDTPLPVPPGHLVTAIASHTAHGDVITGISATDRAAWHRALDEHYKEHRGEFRPEVV